MYLYFGSHFPFYALAIIGNLLWNMFSPRMQNVCRKIVTNNCNRRLIESHQHWNFIHAKKNDTYNTITMPTTMSTTATTTTTTTKKVTHSEKATRKKKKRHTPSAWNMARTRTMWCEREMGIIYGGNLSETERSECVHQHAPNELTIFNSFAFYFSLFSIFHWSRCVFFFVWLSPNSIVVVFVFFFFFDTVVGSSPLFDLLLNLSHVKIKSDETMKKPKCNMFHLVGFFFVVVLSYVNQRDINAEQQQFHGYCSTSVECGKKICIGLCTVLLFMCIVAFMCCVVFTIQINI